MTVQMPKAPRRIEKLPRDKRGYIVPRFVLWMREGRPAARGSIGAEPDFRIMDSEFYRDALAKHLCWICGELMGVHKVFVIGPMCAVNRVTLEPPNHRECAEYAVQVCPFLAKPRMRRNDKGLEETLGGAKSLHVPGLMIERNPGCSCLWETNDYRLIRAGAGGPGVLIRLGEPAQVDFWAEGRAATRKEVMASIDSGYPLLHEMAKKDGAQALLELERWRVDAMRFLPAA